MLAYFASICQSNNRHDDDGDDGDGDSDRFSLGTIGGGLPSDCSFTVTIEVPPDQVIETPVCLKCLVVEL